MNGWRRIRRSRASQPEQSQTLFDELGADDDLKASFKQAELENRLARTSVLVREVCETLGFEFHPETFVVGELVQGALRIGVNPFEVLPWFAEHRFFEGALEAIEERR